MCPVPSHIDRKNREVADIQELGGLLLRELLSESGSA